jgi:hypothetical protein
VPHSSSTGPFCPHLVNGSSSKLPDSIFRRLHGEGRRCAFPCQTESCLTVPLPPLCHRSSLPTVAGPHHQAPPHGGLPSRCACCSLLSLASSQEAPRAHPASLMQGEPLSHRRWPCHRTGHRCGDCTPPVPHVLRGVGWSDRFCRWTGPEQRGRGPFWLVLFIGFPF